MSEPHPHSGQPLDFQGSSPGEGVELEKHWMAALQERDESAFQNLFRQFGERAFAVCLRVLRDRQAAEDVLSEVFWQIWEHPERYDSSRSSPRTYILLVARSRAIDRLRSLGRQGELVCYKQVPYLETNSTDRIPSPVDQTREEEEARLIRKALEELGTSQRTALELSFFEGLSHQQIAERMETPLGTIKSRIRQGLIHLRTRLSSKFPERSQL